MTKGVGAGESTSSSLSRNEMPLQVQSAACMQRIKDSRAHCFFLNFLVTYTWKLGYVPVPINIIYLNHAFLTSLKFQRERERERCRETCQVRLKFEVVQSPSTAPNLELNSEIKPHFIIFLLYFKRSRDSSVSIETRLRVGQPWFDSR